MLCTVHLGVWYTSSMVLLILNYDRVILSRKLYDVSAFLCIIPPGWTVNKRKKLQSSKYGHGKCFIENMIFHKLHCISWITILFERSHMFPFCFDFLIYQLAKVFQHSIKWHCSWQFYINHDPSLCNYIKMITLFKTAR